MLRADAEPSRFLGRPTTTHASPCRAGRASAAALNLVLLGMTSSPRVVSDLRGEKTLPFRRRPPGEGRWKHARDAYSKYLIPLAGIDISKKLAFFLGGIARRP